MALIPKSKSVQSIAQRVDLASNDDPAPAGHRALQELTELEAAAELRVSVDTLQRERAAGKIRFVQRRRRVLYPMFCINEYRLSQVTSECLTSGSTVKALRATGMSSGAKEDERNAALWARRLRR